jgi:hypothetical protein
MTAGASLYFGEDSNGLKRKALPAGFVEIGAVKSLGVVALDSVKAPAKAPSK